MKQFKIVMSVAFLLAASSLIAAEAEKKTESGLQAGKPIGAFNVTKLAGAEDDGVEVGKNLCYRCKNGGRPQVIIFTRSSDEAVVKLVQMLDKAIPKNDEKQLRAFVNYLGKDKSSATKDAKKLAETTKAKNVPFVLPNEFENGPEDYGINPKAEVTVILAEDGSVKANYAVASAKELKVDAVMAGLAKILN